MRQRELPTFPRGYRPSAGADFFADFVRRRLDADVLRYSNRLELLRLAERFNIGRFEALLLIARVQHQAKRMLSRSRIKSPTRLAVLAAAGVTQAALALLAWIFIAS